MQVEIMRESGNVDFSEHFCARKIIVEFKRLDNQLNRLIVRH